MSKIAEVIGYRTIEAVDTLINAFQSQFGPSWKPSNGVRQAMFQSLQALIVAPEEPEFAYEHRLDDWSAACNDFVTSVFLSM